MPGSIPIHQVTEHAVDIMSLIDMLKWPLVALIALLFIRKSIIGLINRITKIGHAGSSVEASQQQVAERQEQKKFSNVEKALGIFRTETIDMVSEVVIRDTDIESMHTDQLKIDSLTNYSIMLYLIKHFESIYYSIFGSQILILQQLNTITYEDLDSLNRYYEYAVKQNPKFFEGYKYSDYINFLLGFNLIVYEGKQINITNLGVDFLKYLTETGKNLNKLN